MEISKRLTVPLCDIMLHIKDGFSENSPSVVNMERACQKKRGRSELPRKAKLKKEKESSFDSENDSEKDNSFKENQNESESDAESIDFKEKEASFDSENDSEKDNSFKENQENEISEFEKMVQKNREEKMAFLQSLKINEIKEEFNESVISMAPKPKPRKPISFKKHNVVPVAPLRKSRRLAKLDIDLSEKALYAKAVAEVSSMEIKLNNPKLNRRPQKTQLKLPGNIKPSELYDQNIKVEELPSNYPFVEAISVKSDFSEFVTNFDFNVENDIKFNPDYASNFKNMMIGESGVAKVVPTRITSLAIHPAADKIMVIVGSKYGHLGFWNVTSSLQPIVFLPHNGGVTNLKVNPYNPLQIISSSYDGTLRCGDMEKKSFIEIYNVSDETACTYFDFVSNTTLLVSQRNGNVSVVDVRNESLNSEKKHRCHEYAVKTVHVYPGNKNLFLTADSKGNMKLWDLRKLQKKSIIDVCHHKRSISSAFFSPITGKYILTTSADDSLCIFNSSNLEEEILFKKSIRHNNWTGRWLTPFKATWLPHSDELFLVGSMNSQRQIEIYNASGNNVFNFINDAYLNSIASTNEFHPSLNVLAGGNSSGKVFIFADFHFKF